MSIMVVRNITELIQLYNKIKEQQELLYKSERNQRETLLSKFKYPMKKHYLRLRI
ncbi:hypothetical protein [Clostridium magnum]|uniref:Uncharacterized protein n=1 Tax=Clostridium magnum DSM 2767 TaxID=1121326 RepID=A0A161WUB8_9CLOT|nr:hypothetical protein [Clostridium magnum]KZL90488.1 hypothetical protein CLMAG_42590 [Clostridium magnum DSM 2767]SHH86517.1 hypothetical protein SAMN02745944_01636 [Clostridium magnum DSM 2767]